MSQMRISADEFQNWEVVEGKGQITGKFQLEPPSWTNSLDKLIILTQHTELCGGCLLQVCCRSVDCDVKINQKYFN